MTKGIMQETIAPPIHPEHRADLERSGLTDKTILQLNIHSARPHDIPRLIGRNAPDVTSALVFPYPGEEDNFYRVKLFPPLKDSNGRMVRYLQPPNSGARFYIHPDVLPKLGNPYEPLGWVEGEKKAGAAVQNRIVCVGLGGLWNFLEKGKPIAKLDQIAHVNRTETIYCDSDVWSRPDLQNAVYAFGRELEFRGANVRVAIIPPAADGSKRGLDDLLYSEGVDALAALDTVSLKHSGFTKAREWWPAWRSAKAAEPEADAPGMTSAEREEALALLQDPQLLTRFLDDTKELGIVGEEENKTALMIAMTSRKLERPSNPTSLILKGESAAGKNFLVEGVASFMPPEDVNFISSATPKSFFYLSKDIRHQIVIIAERQGAEDADYSIRTFQSEGKITILVPEKVGGRIETKERVVEGPVCFIETTTKPHLHAENETRTFDLYLDESEAQTEAIFAAQNRRYLGLLHPAPDSLLKVWRNAQRLLAKLPVLIPYVEGIRFPKTPLRVRRDRPRFLGMIEACCLLHECQRELREVHGRKCLVASLEDYAITRELVLKMLGPALSGATPKARRVVEIAATFGVDEFTRADIQAKGFKYSAPTTLKYLREAVELGCLEARDLDKQGKTAWFKFVHRVVDADTLLPTVEEVRRNLAEAGQSF